MSNHHGISNCARDSKELKNAVLFAHLFAFLFTTKAEKGLPTSYFRLQTSDFSIATSDFPTTPENTITYHNTPCLTPQNFA